MADISIVIPLDGNSVQFNALCESLAGTEDEIAQIVVVCPGDAGVTDEDLAGLPIEPLVIEHDGTLGDMWNAAVPACTSEYVYPASCRIRFSKAFYRIICAQVTRAPVDLLCFHLQEFDLATQTYVSRRLSQRLCLPAMPFQPNEYPRFIFQRLGTNPCSAIFSKRFIIEKGFEFASIASFDDDPAFVKLIPDAEAISFLPWPLAVLAYDSNTLFDDIDDDAFLERYAVFQRLFGDGIPPVGMLDSHVEWCVAFATRHYDDAPDALAERMLDAMGATVLPVIGAHLEERRDVLRIEGAETLLLSKLSRSELIDSIATLRAAGGEERYRSEMLQIMLERARVGSTGTTRPRKRGLFRR